MRRGARTEDGFVVPTAIALLAIVLLLGFVGLHTVDVQSHQTGHETAGEAAFTLAESALDAEAEQVKDDWPSAAGSYSWTTCNQASAPVPGCAGTTVTNAFATTYAGQLYGAATWSASVLDDSGSYGANYYTDALVGVAPIWDANGDNKLWIRAQATVNGQTRAVVSQITRQVHVVTLPHNVITSGGVFTSNDGNKIIIESSDPVSYTSGGVALRCTTGGTGPSYQAGCAGWDPAKGQLDPLSNYQTGYVDPNASYAALPPPTLAQLRATAMSNGTDYPPGACPPAGTSGVLFVENANCSYTGNANWNSAASPGMLIVANGTLSFGGTQNFYGIIYLADGQGTAPSSGPCTAAQQNGPVFTVHGNGTLFGALFVDNCGTVDAGSSAYNIQYSLSAFGGARAYSTPALAKNTFRLLPGG